MYEKDPQIHEVIGSFATMEFKLPEVSKWQCHLFGCNSIVWRPNKGQEPNWFWRQMQFLAFGNRWVKDKE